MVCTYTTRCPFGRRYAAQGRQGTSGWREAQRVWCCTKELRGGLRDMSQAAVLTWMWQ